MEVFNEFPCAAWIGTHASTVSEINAPPPSVERRRSSAKSDHTKTSKRTIVVPIHENDDSVQMNTTAVAGQPIARSEDDASKAAEAKLFAKVNCVAFSPDGEFVASGGNNGKLTLWNVQEGLMRKPERNIFEWESLHDSDGVVIRVTCVAFKNDGQDVVSGDSSGNVRMRSWKV